MMIMIAWGVVAALADGDSALARGDYAAAETHYRTELEAYPESYDAKYKLARVLSFTNRRDDAIRLYSELLSTRPTNSDLLLGRGRTYAWEGRWKEAEADLTAVTTQSPDYGDAWSALGDMYVWSDRPSAAVDAYGRWIAAEPGNARAYVARAKTHRSQGKVDAARADFMAARARGAPPAEIDAFLLSLVERRPVQESVAPEEYKWSMSLGYGGSGFAPARGEWRDHGAAVRRHLTRGSLAVEYLGAERFDEYDYAIALDAYVDLWSRSYANLRYQYSPDKVLYPDNSYRAEIYQGLGKGWELSGSHDHMNFGDNNVDMYGAGLGKYVANYYLRWRTLFIPSTAKLGVSHRAMMRYYFSGNADDYVELSGGFSHGGQFVRNTTVVETTRSSSVGGAIQKYFGPRWGLKLSGGYSDDDNSFVERSISAGIYTRW
jgi:YaiO family outer membrane protein